MTADTADDSVHPLVKLTTSHLVDHQDGLQLSQQGVVALSEALASQRGTPDLPEAFMVLVRLAYVMGTSSQSPAAASSILAVASTVIDELDTSDDKISEALRAAETASERFAAFVGNETDGRVPEDTEQDENAVKLSELFENRPRKA